MNRTCKDCPFWDRFTPSGSQGRCRVNPPTLAGDSEIGVWPITFDKQWCAIVRPELRVPREVKA